MFFDWLPRNLILSLYGRQKLKTNLFMIRRVTRKYIGLSNKSDTLVQWTIQLTSA